MTHRSKRWDISLMQEARQFYINIKWILDISVLRLELINRM